MKKALKIIAIVALTMATPIMTMAEELYDGPETEVSTTSISVEGTRVRVCGAAGKTLEVYNVTGSRVTSVRIESSDQTVELNLQRGCYIFKVDKVVRKFSIK